MSTEEESKRSGVINAIGIALIAISYTGALLNMLNTQRTEMFGEKKVIRICHWQLESGFREGLDYAIKEFEKINPDVKIIQLPIYQRAYLQFTRTQLIGGTAPDLIEADMLSGGAAMQMAGRYFYPLTRELYKVNEYNADNEFKNTPWIHTFCDGLQGSANISDLEIYTAGLNTFSTRLFYNKTMVRQIMGVDTIPADYHSFVLLCDSVVSYAKRTGKVLFPIAGANYQTPQVSGAYFPAIVPQYFFYFDKNYECTGVAYEKLFGYIRGEYSFLDPQVEAGEEISRKLAKYYQPGFMAQDRMESGFAFSQQRALIISSGNWDYQSLRTHAEENGFKVGIARLPMPTMSDPDYGKYVLGELYEPAWTAGRFAITRGSKHPDIALKFLKFLTSVSINSKVNDIIGWIPSIRNAPVRDELKPFLLVQKGYPAFFDEYLARVGKKTNANDDQAYWEYISGTTGYDEYAKQIEKRYVVDGIYDVYQDMLILLDQIKQNDHDRSYYSAMMGVSSGATMDRSEMLTKLRAVTKLYEANQFNIADRGFGLWQVMNLKNERAAKLDGAAEYHAMVKKFGFDNK